MFVVYVGCASRTHYFVVVTHYFVMSNMSVKMDLLHLLFFVPAMFTLC